MGFHHDALCYPATLPSAMDPRELFEANLPLIDRISRRVAARGGLSRDDAEDFASDFRIALMENDWAVMRQWEGRAALGTFLSIVAQRVFADARRRVLGKWRPSAEAQRLGDAAVMLERLVRRSGQTLAAALPVVRGVDPLMTDEDARKILERLPERPPRPRLVALDTELEIPSIRDRAEAGAESREVKRLAERTSAVLRGAIAAMPPEDRTVVRFRFGSSLTIASIARMLRVPQRPLYRRIEAIIARLREALREAGIDAEAIEQVIGSPAGSVENLWKEEPARPAIQKELGRDGAEERWP